MRHRYSPAVFAAVIAAGAVVWGLVDPGDMGMLGLLVGAAGFPVAVLLAISARVDLPTPLGSLLGGATIGPLVSVLSHAFVFGFAYLFFLGFADAAVSLVESFRIDPAIVEVAGSPWTLLLFFELVLVAPLTEEAGKALGSWVQRPSGRQQAFMAGVAAGVGFAITENILYAAGGIWFGTPWDAIVTVRVLGAAVHPLASGLVVLGWWEWREGGELALLVRRFLAGAGVHALWNGSIVVLGVVGEAYGVDRLLGLGSLGIAYSAGLGVLAAASVWLVAGSIADQRPALFAFDGTDARTIGGWAVLAASLLLPVALLFLAYPEFVGR